MNKPAALVIRCRRHLFVRNDRASVFRGLIADQFTLWAFHRIRAAVTVIPDDYVNCPDNEKTGD
jgi:hypothetical protein